MSSSPNWTPGLVRVLCPLMCPPGGSKHRPSEGHPPGRRFPDGTLWVLL